MILVTDEGLIMPSTKDQVVWSIDDHQMLFLRWIANDWYLYV